MGVPTSPEDHEDLSEYKFQKFAATYFQGAYAHQYSKKPLKHSLLPLQTQGDQLVSPREDEKIGFFENLEILTPKRLYSRLAKHSSQTYPPCNRRRTNNF